MAGQKTIIILSGGLDSTTLLFHLLANGDTVKALTFNYGQRHVREIEAAKDVAEVAGLVPGKTHEIVDVRMLRRLLGGSSQTSNIIVPEGHYAAENMKLTVVPNRNMIMLAIACGWAVASEFDRVAIAAHGGDHAIYPDCREEFFAPLNLAFHLGNYHQVDLYRPYLEWTKAMIVSQGAQLEAPLDLTYSCYKGHETHCGKCGTCVERKEAFQLAGVEDPTNYSDYEDAA